MKDSIEKAILLRKPDFKKCHDVEVDPTLDLEGRIEVSFFITPQGRARDARVVRSTMHHPRLEACILRTMEKVSFQKPSDGKEIQVKYPFNFESS